MSWAAFAVWQLYTAEVHRYAVTRLYLVQNRRDMILLFRTFSAFQECSDQRQYLHDLRNKLRVSLQECNVFKGNSGREGTLNKHWPTCFPDIQEMWICHAAKAVLWQIADVVTDWSLKIQNFCDVTACRFLNIYWLSEQRAASIFSI